MKLRKLLLVVVAVVGLALPALPAHAVCGGGGPGEPCYCPSEITVGSKSFPTGITC